MSLVWIAERARAVVYLRPGRFEARRKGRFVRPGSSEGFLEVRERVGRFLIPHIPHGTSKREIRPYGILLTSSGFRSSGFEGFHEIQNLLLCRLRKDSQMLDNSLCCRHGIASINISIIAANLGRVNSGRPGSVISRDRPVPQRLPDVNESNRVDPILEFRYDTHCGGRWF